MQAKTKSRREALGLIGKTGAFLGASPYFFLSLETRPAGAGTARTGLSGAERRKVQPVQEKAVISGSGSKLIVTITGMPGRHFFVAMAGKDAKEKYRSYPNSAGVIDAKGKGSVSIDMKTIENSRVYLKLITAQTNKFDSQKAETEAFIISTKDGKIQSFEGVVSRPLRDAAGLSASSTPAAVIACGGKYRFELD